MIANTPRAGRPSAWPATCLLALLLLVGAARADDDPAPTAPAPEDAHTRIGFQGRATIKEFGFLGQSEFRLDLTVSNAGALPLEILTANLMLGHPGGWLAPLDPEPLDGSFFRGPLAVGAGEERPAASQVYKAASPASHAVLAVQARDGHAEVVLPILREGHAEPDPLRVDYPFGVGIMGPLHALPYADGSTSVLLIGQHQFLGGHVPERLITRVQAGSDAGAGEEVTWEGLDAQGDLVALWPFARRLDVFSAFRSGVLRLTSTATIDGREHTVTATWPVTRMEPITVLAPVLGTWQLSNGPGRMAAGGHDARPQSRYGYDLVVLEQGRTHQGDPHRNESYFAWNRSVRAVADGEVVDVCDRERDNPGYRGALSQCGVNRVVLRHANGLYSAYLHLRHHSTTQSVLLGSRVKAGQVLARVGNSGDSSEPHLHFMAFRFDATGRVESVPVSFENAFRDAAGRDPVRGVPLGGETYQFRNP